MTYRDYGVKVLGQDVLGRDVDAIVSAVDSIVSDELIRKVVASLLEDAFLRGRNHGIDTVLEDPAVFDLRSTEVE